MSRDCRRSLGGVTAGLLLRDAGSEVDVFERSATGLFGYGAGLGVDAPTTDYLRERLGTDVDALSFVPRSVRYLDRSGELVYEGRFGAAGEHLDDPPSPSHGPSTSSSRTACARSSTSSSALTGSDRLFARSSFRTGRSGAPGTCREGRLTPYRGRPSRRQGLSGRRPRLGAGVDGGRPPGKLDQIFAIRHCRE